MYLGRTTAAALAETLLRDPAQEKVLWSDVVNRRATRMETTASLRLVTVHGPGLAYLGIQQADVVSCSYEIPQKLSARIHAETKFDGLQYRSRFDSDELCVALFQRSSHKVCLLAEGLPLDRSMIRTFLEGRGKRLAVR